MHPSLPVLYDRVAIEKVYILRNLSILQVQGQSYCMQRPAAVQQQDSCSKVPSERDT